MHIDGAALSRLFGGGGSAGIRLVNEGRPQSLQRWLQQKDPDDDRGFVIRGGG